MSMLLDEKYKNNKIIFNRLPNGMVNVRILTHENVYVTQFNAHSKDQGLTEAKDFIDKMSMSTVGIMKRTPKGMVVTASDGTKVVGKKFKFHR